MGEENETNETNKTGEGDNSNSKDDKNNEDSGKKPLNIVDEAKALRDEIKTERVRLTEERKTLENTQAEGILHGKADTGQEKEEKKEETNHEYRIRIEKELAEGKTEFGD